MNMKRMVFVILILAAAWGPGLAAEACEHGARRCSDDAYVLEVCEHGAWTATQCMRDSGLLCEQGACVAPWRFGNPAWPRAAEEPGATAESLARKAAYFDDIAARLHVHPRLKWIMSVTLKPDPADPARAAVPQERASWRDVESWHTGENDGLWNALYLAAQAYRYAATRDPAALDMIRLLLDGTAVRMRVTGVPGIYTRQYIPPDVAGLACPGDPGEYMPDTEKDDNKWVRIGDDGCVRTVNPASGEWQATTHCGLEEFAGWCWLDNVSKDEYSGHLFALGAVAALVDDPAARDMARAELDQIGRHLVQNRMEFVDWDGRTAEHGPIHAVTFGDYPGFNAAMALSFIKTIAAGTGDARYERFYRDCLLQQSGKVNCLKKKWEKPRPYTEYLSTNGMYPGPEGCGANFNNISMHMLSMFSLIGFERDPALREIYQASFDTDVVRAPGQPRAIILQNNAWFDFMWAAMKKLGPNSDGPALAAVDNGIRMLRRFPAAKSMRNLPCPPGKCAPYCENRFGNPAGNYARKPDERCPGTFLWWRDPYDLGACADNPRIVIQPADYLLAYWMGRYYGFISEDM